MRCLVALLIAFAACGESLPRASLAGSEAPPAVQSACALTEHECSRCHAIGRILTYDAVTREQWEPIVHRMRRLPSSGITPADAEVVLECLSSRSR